MEPWLFLALLVSLLFSLQTSHTNVGFAVYGPLAEPVYGPSIVGGTEAISAKAVDDVKGKSASLSAQLMLIKLRSSLRSWCSSLRSIS